MQQQDNIQSISSSMNITHYYQHELFTSQFFRFKRGQFSFQSINILFRSVGVQTCILLN